MKCTTADECDPKKKKLSWIVSEHWPDFYFLTSIIGLAKYTGIFRVKCVHIIYFFQLSYSVLSPGIWTNLPRLISRLKPLRPDFPSHIYGTITFLLSRRTHSFVFPFPSKCLHVYSFNSFPPDFTFTLSIFPSKRFHWLSFPSNLYIRPILLPSKLQLHLYWFFNPPPNIYTFLKTSFQNYSSAVQTIYVHSCYGGGSSSLFLFLLRGNPFSTAHLHTHALSSLSLSLSF